MPKPARPAWLFAEYAPVGVDLASPEAVAAYDRNQGTDAARDDALLDRLGVTHGTRLVDLACGTGSFPVQAALRGAEAHGVDVGEEMLAYARKRAEREGTRVRWHHAGFLDYVHEGDPADVVTTKAALHQLPDFWKQQALLNAASFLRPGGTFYLWDVIFTFPPDQATENLDWWVDTAARAEGEGFTRQTFETHIREEFSTYSWILEGLFERAGLEVISKDFTSPVHGEYICRKS
ncbi:class I SAM-dependent methyltransferase [Streptomyces boninensis]|uniref:class I SAM-dependent methyltransferase n=1 Tax=Streptomyces boninensis TaxID=2039455 RepID=UPI003B21A557